MVCILLKQFVQVNIRFRGVFGEGIFFIVIVIIIGEKGDIKNKQINKYKILVLVIAIVVIQEIMMKNKKYRFNNFINEKYYEKFEYRWAVCNFSIKELSLVI